MNMVHRLVDEPECSRHLADRVPILMYGLHGHFGRGRWKQRQRQQGKREAESAADTLEFIYPANRVGMLFPVTAKSNIFNSPLLSSLQAKPVLPTTVRTTLSRTIEDGGRPNWPRGLRRSLTSC